MRNVWRKVWYSEPVVFVGALTSGWTAVAAFDKASTEFDIPVWGYVVATATVPILTGLVRGKVTPTDA